MKTFIVILSLLTTGISLNAEEKPTLGLFKCESADKSVSFTVREVTLGDFRIFGLGEDSQESSLSYKEENGHKFYNHSEHLELYITDSPATGSFSVDYYREYENLECCKEKGLLSIEQCR